MKVKILKPSGWYRNRVGIEFEVNSYDLTSSAGLRSFVFNQGWIYSCNCVITELPESFCVKKCDDVEKWRKYVNWLNKTYVNWLNKTYGSEFSGNHLDYYGIWENGFYCNDKLFGMEIHIDDIIKHIDFYSEPMVVESEEEFDLTTDEGRLVYARKYYPIGTKYKPLLGDGEVSYSRPEVTANFKPRIWVTDASDNRGIEVSKVGLIYHEKTNRWAEIIKEEKNMETQKLSRQGLKEIHSVACSSWKETLEQFGRRNPLEDYIELTQEEINIMFDACTKEQLPIVSKYLKKDEGSVNFNDISGDEYKLNGRQLIGKRVLGQYKNKSFYLDSHTFDWEIRKDEYGELCLIPTKKK